MKLKPIPNNQGLFNYSKILFIDNFLRGCFSGFPLCCILFYCFRDFFRLKTTHYSGDINKWIYWAEIYNSSGYDGLIRHYDKENKKWEWGQYVGCWLCYKRGQAKKI